MILIGHDGDNFFLAPYVPPAPIQSADIPVIDLDALQIERCKNPRWFHFGVNNEREMETT